MQSVGPDFPAAASPAIGPDGFRLADE